MKLYKYLPKEEFINTWVNGGKIPLKLASAFFSIERSKTKTPDENRVINLRTSLTNEEFKKLYKIEPTNKTNIIISGNYIENKDGINDDGTTEFSQKVVDGYVMSFCTELSRKVSEQLEMPYAIKITNPKKLKDAINRQIEFEFSEGMCEYTSEENQGVYLKGVEDRWQNEYRFFWKTTNACENEISVEIPRNIAELAKF